MPRPRRTRKAASTRAKPAAPARPAKHPFELKSEIYDVSDRESVMEPTPLRITSRRMASQQAALEAQRRRRDDAMQRVENTTSNSTADDTNATEDDDAESSIEVGRRDPMAATPANGIMADVSGFDLDDSIFDDLNTTVNTVGPGSALRGDSSSLTASYFKRRPRAGSFLNRNDGPLRPSSRAGPNTPSISSTFNIGMFKRRKREPSILGTVRKERVEKPQLEGDAGERSDEGEETEREKENRDEFAPVAESTPLPRSKRQSGVSEAEAAAAEKGSPSANPRKRKSEGRHEERPRRPARIEGLEEWVSEVETGSPQSLPPAIARDSTPVMDDDTIIAPPASSSSSEGDADIWPPIEVLARGRAQRPASALRRTPVRDVDNLSDISSPPSLTYSPNYPPQSVIPKRSKPVARRAATKPEPKMTTAELEALLPRRRHKAIMAGGDESDAEVDASDLRQDDDELTFIDVRARRKSKRPLSRAASDKNRSSSPKSKSAERKGMATDSTKNARRTYGRSSDKENDEGTAQDDDSDPFIDEDSTVLVERMGEELKNAKRKFQEVDKWELEFEEMTQSSSPRDGR